MKSKSFMLLLVAGGCGLVAMLGVQQMLSGGRQDSPKVRILVAKTDIESGIRLDKTNVTVKEVSQEAAPEGAVTKEEQFTDRALKHRIGQGQPILISELGNKGEYGLDMQIPAEMRVASIPVTATMTHSGLLKPGNFVDVNAAVETQGNNGIRRSEVKPVLQCIQVFAIDSQVVGSEEAKDQKAKESKNVSFLVYPLQAQLLHLAYKQSNGNLQFALRSSSDKSLANSSDLSEEALSSLKNSLLGIKEEAERKEVAEKPSTAQPPVKARNAFRSYLAPETPASVISAGEKASRRTWTIEIFQGDQREVQELDWPEDVPGDAIRSSGATSKTSGDASKSWKNPLMKLSKSGPKADTSDVKESESGSTNSQDKSVDTELLDRVSKALKDASAINEE